MVATTAKEMKALGRLVKGFDAATWSAQAERIVCEANLAKFGQNPALSAYLRRTGEAVLVEASPVDAIWGIGLAEGAAGIGDPRQWRGKNLLGFILMAVRAEWA